MQIHKWSDIERITNVTKHRVKYAIERGRLGGFMMVNGAYVFSDEDVARIESYFAGLKPWQRENDNNRNVEEGREE